MKIYQISDKMLHNNVKTIQNYRYQYEARAY